MMLEKFKKFTIGIAGCGGLGSNCAVSLARCAVGRLIIADFDTVEKSNLNRQYYFLNQIGQPKVHALKANIQKINPQVKVRTHRIKLDPGNILQIFSDCQVIVEAFDRADQKQMLIETVLEHFPDKYIVAASGLAGIGFNNELKTVCFGKLYICGDFQREVSESLPPLAPRVGIVANMQANQVLEILLKLL